jgi:hypothetical protein
VSCIVQGRSLSDDVTPEAFLMMDNTTPHSLNSPSVAFSLLSYYSPEQEPYLRPWTKGKLLARWQRTYPEQWICWALIESLYQGRYKTYCVEQILALWLRRGEPIYHFNYEFEAMICNKVPQRIETVDGPEPSGNAVPDNAALLHDSEDLGDAIGPSLSNPCSEDVSEVVSLGDEPEGLEPVRVGEEREVDWTDAFEQPATGKREFDLASVLSRNQLLPLTFGRMGLEPIHRFMPEAEPIEFCEKLDAIAAHQELDRSHH